MQILSQKIRFPNMSVNKAKRRPNMSECLDVFLLPGFEKQRYNKKGKGLPGYLHPAGKRRMFMGEKGCSISEAAKRSGVEAYVLRYWEEEGLLKVPRNAKGHRCYTEAEFAAIRSIQEMKKEGLSLKDIRDVKEHPKHPTEKIQEQKTEAQRTEAQKTETQRTEEEKKQQFYVILERLVKEISLTRNREARYRRLDEAIRRQQESRKMTAVTEERNTHGKNR